MHQNQQGIYNNQMSSHASLLLSASPTIINSPLQNNTNNNPQTPAVTPSSVGIARRQPNALLLVSASNLDHNDSHLNSDSPSNNCAQEGYINFKKPQNEMFKRLDGKIQKIVAAHSNLNKLYALNDFSSLGPGPKRPFELPPQLPPPPPWIPKVAAEYVNQWNEDTMNPLNVLNEPTNLEVTDFSPNSGLFGPNSSIMKTLNNLKPSTNLLATTTASRGSSLTIDSAISKLHQRRQQQQQQQQKHPQSRLSQQVDLVGPIPCSSSSSTASPPPIITPAQFSLLAQKIKETFESECSTKTQGGNILNGDKKKLREDLIALLKEEISAVTKSTKFRFSTPVKQTQPKTNEQKSLLLKSSPQTLYNTIHRETSLLLNKRDHSVRSNLSLLPDHQAFNRQNAQHEFMSSASNRDRGNRMMVQTIKVIIPPTEFHQSSPSKSEAKESSENFNRCSETSESQQNSLNKNHKLTYQVIRNKIRLFQETNQIYLGKSHKFAHGLMGSSPGLRKRKSPQKTLDRIVDRLQARWSPTSTEVDGAPMQGVQRKASLQQQIINSSASLLQSSRNAPTISAPTPIPVFRSPLTMTAKGSYFYATSAASKIVNSKSKKSKRFHYLGLKISNYLERECPQPTTEKITIEQFAKCLDLVRSNDLSLQQRQEQLSQSESKWRMPVGNRPLRLRRIRGDRIHMPASASYKATRKVGLQ